MKKKNKQLFQYSQKEEEEGNSAGLLYNKIIYNI